MSAPINTAPREGWRNKHIDPMPAEDCNMMIQYREAGAEEGELVGRWIPNQFINSTLPGLSSDNRNLLGKFICVTHYYPYHSFALHAWRGNDHEFTYYKIL